MRADDAGRRIRSARNGSKDAREAKLIRLGQLEDALLRDARFIVGIEMHTGKMSFDEAVEFFVKEGYQAKETGLVETKRGTAIRRIFITRWASFRS